MAARTRAPRSRRQLRQAARKSAGKKSLRKGSKSSARRKGARAGAIEIALATFAHEVRTPLTGILALSSLLETSGLPERERRWVNSIKASAEHLSALATLFVDAARHRGPGLSMRQDFFDLRTLAQTAANSLAGRAAAKGLVATSEIDAALPVFAVGDPVRLRAALENLIDNAVKFTDSGSVVFAASLARAPKPRGAFAVAFNVAELRRRALGHRDQAVVQAVLSIQCRDQPPIWRRGAWSVIGAAAGARNGRRRHGQAAARRRHRIHADALCSIMPMAACRRPMPTDPEWPPVSSR